MNKKQKQKEEPYMNIIFKDLPSMDSFLQLDPISERLHTPLKEQACCCEPRRLI